MAEMVKTTLNGEFEIIIPKHRAERPEWYEEGGWEKKRLQSMHKNLGKGDVVFYVGAEEGEMPALCQMWGAKVVLFEPNDLVWPNIKAIWDANNLEKPLGIFNGFASNVNHKVGENFRAVWPDSASGEVISNHGFKELVAAGEIGQVRIDTLVEQYGIIPTMITMDVEGSEWEVLKGAENTLRNHRLMIYLSLHPEFMYHHYKVHSGDLRRWIRDFGYNEELLDYQHEVHLLYTKK